jgi:N-hydroxyarylamine O-acetyltransferase
MLDLDAYAGRIGWSGPRNADAETLAAIHRAHATHVPFENLAIHQGVGIDLAPEKIFEKIVGRRRGGYCFEQNALLLDVLRAIGFTARPLAARVLAGRSPVRRPRSHMALLASAGARTYLADVGFGVHNLLLPMPFEPGVERTIGVETFRLREIGWDGRALAPPPAFDLEVREGDAWAPLYRVSLEDQERIDFVQANWFTSTHPDSLFVKKRIVSSVAVDGTRQLLLERELETRRPDGTKETRTIAEGDAAYAAALRELFDLAI